MEVILVDFLAVEDVHDLQHAFIRFFLVNEQALARRLVMLVVVRVLARCEL